MGIILGVGLVVLSSCGSVADVLPPKSLPNGFDNTDYPNIARPVNKDSLDDSITDSTDNKSNDNEDNKDKTTNGS